MGNFDNIPGDSYVEVTIRGYAIASGKDSIVIASSIDDNYDYNYDEISLNLDSFKEIEVTVLPTPFPSKLGKIIVNNESKAALVRNAAGEWIDLVSNLIYAEEDLGSFADYHEYDPEDEDY